MFKRKMIKVINDDRRRRTGTKRKERADEEDNGDVLTEVHHEKNKIRVRATDFFLQPCTGGKKYKGCKEGSCETFR